MNVDHVCQTSRQHQFLSEDAAGSMAEEPLTFPPMPAEYRKCLHMLAERWGLRSESVAEKEAGVSDKDDRYTQVWLRPSTEPPLLTLSDLRASPKRTDCILSDDSASARLRNTALYRTELRNAVCICMRRLAL